MSFPLRTGLVLGSVFAAAAARADTDGGEDEVAGLLRRLEEEHASLSTEDCTTACRALSSIRRAADRICALDDGDRCSEARSKADDARRRVAEACPDCAIAQGPLPGGDDRRASEEPKAAPESTTERTLVRTAPEKKGGCASCSEAGAPDAGSVGVVLFAAWAALGARSRKKKPGEKSPRDL